MSIMDKDDLVWEALKNPKTYQKQQQEMHEKIKQNAQANSLRERVQAILKKTALII